MRWQLVLVAAGRSYDVTTIEVSEGGALVVDPGAEIRTDMSVELIVPHIGTLAARVAGRQPLGLRLIFNPPGMETLTRLQRRLASAAAAEARIKADQVTAVIERALDEGRIEMEVVFDEDYQPIVGSNPVQVTTRCLPFLDAVLPGILEPALQVDPSIVFCAAVDRNGYLPVHNQRFSHPQGPDPAVNEGRSRNRRIFDDRTGLSAARNNRDFLVQPYLRDMGGGVKVLMKDMSTPIFIRGRHWGALRMGVKVD